MAEDTKVKLDTKKLDEEVNDTEEKKAPAKAEQKVELDLDDAPFLEDVEEEKEEEKKSQTEEEKTEEKEEKTEEEEKEEEPKKKKKVIIFIALGLCILLISGGLYFFLTKSKEEKPPPPPPRQVKVQEKPPPPKPEAIQYSFRPFWVDYKVNNEHRFLHLTLTIEYIEKRINWELVQKNIVIRDEIYYYLKNKDINFFSDKKNIQTLKQDLMAIINQYLGYGKISAIYLKDFLIE